MARVLIKTVAVVALVLFFGFTPSPARAVTVDDPWPIPAGREITDPQELADRASGFWSGDWGNIVFRIRSDGTVIAAYDHNQGVIVGWLNGARIDGWWCEVPTHQPPGDAGTVQFRMLDVDGEPTLDGRWTYGPSDQVAVFSENWDVTGRGDAEPSASLLERLDQAEQICVNPNTRPRPFTTLTGFGVATPSVISSLVTLQDLDLSPQRAAAIGGAAVVMVALVVLPQGLIDATIQANYDRLSSWGRRVARFRRVPSSRRLDQRFLVIAGVVLTAIISGLVEPGFGLNWGSLRLTASLALSVFVESVLVLWIVDRFVLRGRSGLRFRFGSLILVLGSVALARLTGFEPGIIFGFVFGLALVSEPSGDSEIKVALYTSGYALMLGIGGWLVYSLLVGAAGGGASGLMTFLIETFGGFAVVGLATLPIALFPLAVTDGGLIFRWSRKVWAVAYAIALTCFFLILMPLPESWSAIDTPFAVWVGLFAGYAALAVTLWAMFGRSRSESTETVAGIEGA